MEAVHWQTCAFVRLTNTETWDEAQEKYASNLQLQKFLKVDLNKSSPQSLIDFCTRAKQSEGQSFDAVNGSTVWINTYVGHVIHSKVTELNGQVIKNAFSGFRGANLAITAFDKVCVLCVQNLSYLPLIL